MANKTWSLASVTASTATDFIVPASSATATVAMARFANTGATAGTLTVTLTDGSNTVLATLIPGITLAAYSVVELPAVMAINPHKIRVTFSQTTLSAYACGSEA